MSNTIDTDEFTRNRIDSGGEPDYRIILDIMGYRKGMEERVHWVIEPVFCEGINSQDTELISAILERVADVYSSQAAEDRAEGPNSHPEGFSDDD